MPTEHTYLKNGSQAGDSNQTDEPVVIGKSNTYQRLILIVTGSFLALLVWIAVTSKNGGHYFKSSAQEIAKGAGALADYQVETANLALTKDIFSAGGFCLKKGSCFEGCGCCFCSPIGNLCIQGNCCGKFCRCCENDRDNNCRAPSICPCGNDNCFDK
mmetsp:Transcript_40521/g.45660  ORF Transcript_40521/g.45660 Transcript_40521/m.45660 type:complete len:158 (-) Transcript_40521:353-826(-)